MGGTEYVATSISTFISHKGNFAKLREAVGSPECKADRRVQAMLSVLAACFR